MLSEPETHFWPDGVRRVVELQDALNLARGYKEDDHRHALVHGGVEPAEVVPLDWTYFATETFPC